MAIYGITAYGTDVYGLGRPTDYVLPSFTASAVNYSTIRVSWAKPSGTIFRYRLLANRYGYPVTETDGSILIDSGAYPGNAYYDSATIPGSYQHYGFYVALDPAATIWVRSGMTGCLTPADFASRQWLTEKLPAHFKYLFNGGELTGDASGNSYLTQFLSILGWGFDYLQTQYGMLAQHLNDPENIPVNDLLNLAAQVGLSYSPSTPAYTIRKGVKYQAVNSREHGTVTGLAGEITIRTGWGADIQAGPNILLNTDQSTFINPVFEPWDAHRYYAVGECVWTGTPTNSRVWSGTGWWYQCLVANQGQPPPGSGGNSTYWQALNNTADFLQTLTNPKTSSPSTWEALNFANPAGFVAAGTLGQALGIANITGAGYAWHGLVLTGTASTPQNYLLRSVARSTSDIAQMPDPGFESGFTIIEPNTRPNPTWVPKNWPRIMVVPYGGGQGSEFPGQKGAKYTYLASAFWTGLYAEISHQKGGAHSGSYCAQFVITGMTQSGGTAYPQSPWLATTSGASVTISAWLKASGTGMTAVPTLTWLDAHGSPLTPTTGTQASLTVNTWQQVSVSGTAPAEAAYLAFEPVIGSSNPNSYSVLVDDIAVTPTGLALANYAPDPQDVIENAIPVPWVRNSQQWNPDTRYKTGDLALYNDQAFQALRASTGAVPPANYMATPEWAPLSESRRIRICESGYMSQNTTVSANEQLPATPFVEWYDQHGNFISRVFGRTSTNNGAVGKPGNLAFDSFTGQSRLTSAAGSGSVTLSPWQATFWANDSMSGPSAYTRTDQSVNFTWTGSQPAPSVGNAGWSAKWVTTFSPVVSGSYTFTLTSPGGGSRMLVNGLTVVNNWTARATAPQSGSITLQAGTTVTVEVDYAAPTAGPGPTSPNLLPATWKPGRLPASWTSPLFPVIAGYYYLYTVSTTAGANAQITAQVSWYDGKTLIHQSTISGSGTVKVGLGNATVPVGANYASVYVSVSGSATGFSQTFTQVLSATVPAGLKLTSPVPFTASAGPQYSNLLTGRVTDDEQHTWQVPVGSFTVTSGQAYPLAQNQRTYALLPGPANTQLAVTLRSLPNGNYAQGIIFRYSDDTHYWRSDQTGIRYCNGGSWTTAARHETPFLPEDRMTVILNGSSITVLRNGQQVSSASNSYNSTYGMHGIISNDVAVS